MIVCAGFPAAQQIGSGEFQPHPRLSGVFVQNRTKLPDSAFHITGFDRNISCEKTVLHLKFGYLAQCLHQRQGLLVLLGMNQRFRAGQ